MEDASSAHVLPTSIPESPLHSELTGQDKVPDVGSSNGQRVHGYGRPVLRGHLDGLQVGVHLRVDGCG